MRPAGTVNPKMNRWAKLFRNAIDGGHRSGFPFCELLEVATVGQNDVQQEQVDNRKKEEVNFPTHLLSSRFLGLCHLFCLPLPPLFSLSLSPNSPEF